MGISEYNLLLMKIDRKYTEHPFYGILRMTAWLRDEGHQVNYKRIGRLWDNIFIEHLWRNIKCEEVL
jgi:putative transposase